MLKAPSSALAASTVPKLSNVLLALASPRLSLAFFVVALASALAVGQGVAPSTAVVAPCLLLVANLIASLLTHPRFRRDLPLLLFHLCLLALVALVGVARLTYFEGFAALTVGETFAGDWENQQRGLWHDGAADRLRFANEHIRETRAAGAPFVVAKNRVRWWDEQGASGVAEISGDQPLLLAGYRLYISPNRGFEPVFLWRDGGDGGLELGKVRLRDRGDGGYTPDGGWQLPNGHEMWVMIEPRPDEKKGGAPARQSWTRDNFNAGSGEHALVVRIGEARHVLRPGDEIELEGGTLRYVELHPWMGYRAAYDPTIPWLVACVMLAVGSLGWYYLGRRASPEPAGEAGNAR